MAAPFELAGDMGFDELLDGLKAAGEETRLRILALLAEGELSVSDLTEILGQSQPRISRHLRLMAEAGLIDRQREGAWAFFRIGRGRAGTLGRQLIGSIAESDSALRLDRQRLAEVRKARAKAAEAYFSRHAPEWDSLRSLHAADAEVEAAILAVAGDRPIRALIDLGTGTGRMLALLGGRARRLVGIDASHAMLAVARASLAAAGLRNVELYQGDINTLHAVERSAFDLAVIHQVLHYLDDPARAIAEAATVLAPGGRLLVVDFAPHEIESLRRDHAHRRLGFARDEIAEAMAAAGLDLLSHTLVPPPEGAADKLTVSLWLGRDRRVITDLPLTAPSTEIA